MAAPGYEQDLKLTTGTPFLALTGELCGVCCEEIGVEKTGRVITAPYYIRILYWIDGERDYLQHTQL